MTREEKITILKDIIDGEIIHPQVRRDVGMWAIKALEQVPCEDCRNCKKWDDCECGRKGHINGTSIGYSIGECKDYEPSGDAVTQAFKRGYDHAMSLKSHEIPQESSGDAVSRQVVKEQMIKYGFHAPDMTVTEFVEDLLPPVKQEPSEIIHGSTYGGVSWGGTYNPQERTGHWIKTIGENGVTSAVRCSECGFEDNRYMLFGFCPNCGARMESEGKE